MSGDVVKSTHGGVVGRWVGPTNTGLSPTRSFPQPHQVVLLPKPNQTASHFTVTRCLLLLTLTHEMFLKVARCLCVIQLDLVTPILLLLQTCFNPGYSTYPPHSCRIGDGPELVGNGVH